MRSTLIGNFRHRSAAAVAPLGGYWGNPGDGVFGNSLGFNAGYDSFVTAMGKSPTLWIGFDQTSAGFAWNDGAQGWVAAAAGYLGSYATDSRTTGKTPVFDWSCGDAINGDNFTTMTAGTMDSAISGTLAGLKAGGYPNNYYLRFCSEFNIGGNFNTVSAANVAAFISAWRHFYTQVKTWAAANSSNIKIIWNPAAGQNSSSPTLTVAAQYPGDAWVDVYGSDWYGAPINSGTDADPRPVTHDGTDPTWFDMQMMFNMANASGKPICLPETGGTDATFATRMCSTLAGRSPRVPIEFIAMWDQNVGDDTPPGVDSLSWSNSVDPNYPTVGAAWKVGLGPTGTVTTP